MRRERRVGESQLTPLTLHWSGKSGSVVNDPTRMIMATSSSGVYGHEVDGELKLSCSKFDVEGVREGRRPNSGHAVDPNVFKTSSWHGEARPLLLSKLS